MNDRLDPDCVAGKHRACLGEAWDDVTDRPTRCECPCHEGTPDDYMEAQTVKETER